MFTGLIEQLGEVVGNTPMKNGRRLLVRSPFTACHAGESIAVNGVCLTLLPDYKEHLQFDVSPETLQCTTLGCLQAGDRVNVERAMSATSRFGGHYVSGHVDTRKMVISVEPIDDYLELIIGTMSRLELQYLPHKGSITIDGVSLTINKVEGNNITLLLVPHTLNATNLAVLKPGNKVNVEFDYLAKMVSHQVSLALEHAK